MEPSDKVRGPDTFVKDHFSKLKKEIADEAADEIRNAIGVELHGTITDVEINLWHPTDRLGIKIDKSGFYLKDRDGLTVMRRPMTKMLFEAIWTAIR